MSFHESSKVMNFSRYLRLSVFCLFGFILLGPQQGCTSIDKEFFSLLRQRETPFALTNCEQLVSDGVAFHLQNSVKEEASVECILPKMYSKRNIPRSIIELQPSVIYLTQEYLQLDFLLLPWTVYSLYIFKDSVEANRILRNGIEEMRIQGGRCKHLELQNELWLVRVEVGSLIKGIGQDTKTPP